MHRTDGAGKQLWQAAYGNRSTHLSNAGEYIIATRDGGYAVYIDSKEWGNPALGGSFALLRLMPDSPDSVDSISFQPDLQVIIPPSSSVG